MKKKLGDQFEGIAGDVGKGVAAVATVGMVIASPSMINPFDLIVLAGKGIKAGLNALDDFITEQQANNNHQHNNNTPALTYAEHEQLQAEYDLDLMLAGDSGDQS